MVEVNSVVAIVVFGSADIPELEEEAGGEGIIWVVDVSVVIGDRSELKLEDDENEVPSVAVESVQLVEEPLAIVTVGWVMDELAIEAEAVSAKDVVVLEP